MQKILRPWPAFILILLVSTLTMLALSACKFGSGGSSSSKTATPPPPRQHCKLMLVTRK